MFRLFIFFSYFKYIDDPYEFDDVPPELRPFSLIKAGKLSAFYMEQLFQEFYTQKSMGGILVLTLFFFNAYVVGAIVHFTSRDIVTPEGHPCETLRDCFFVMLRLITYDGTGFDTMQAFIDQADVGIVFLLFLLVIFDGVILINGLIGIFGHTFTTTDEEVLMLLDRTAALEDKLSQNFTLMKYLVSRGAAAGELDIDAILQQGRQTGPRSMRAGTYRKSSIAQRESDHRASRGTVSPGKVYLAPHDAGTRVSATQDNSEMHVEHAASMGLEMPLNRAEVTAANSANARGRRSQSRLNNNPDDLQDVSDP